MRADQQFDIPEVPGYTICNAQRKGQDKGGGGLTILYKSELPVHAYQPTVPDHLNNLMNERQW